MIWLKLNSNAQVEGVQSLPHTDCGRFSWGSNFLLCGWRKKTKKGERNQRKNMRGRTKDSWDGTIWSHFITKSTCKNLSLYWFLWLCLAHAIVIFFSSIFCIWTMQINVYYIVTGKKKLNNLVHIPIIIIFCVCVRCIKRGYICRSIPSYRFYMKKNYLEDM